ncbi:hypothetical protein PILCRDRAFT_32092, partial [Piloderma croceum F 1598]
MNTINISTGFSPFQLHMGRAPPLIPPLILNDTPIPNEMNHSVAIELFEWIKCDISEAQDNLLAAKISQAEFANRCRGDEVVYEVGEHVMLSMKHRRHEYLQKHSGQVAK